MNDEDISQIREGWIKFCLSTTPVDQPKAEVAQEVEKLSKNSR